MMLARHCLVNNRDKDIVILQTFQVIVLARYLLGVAWCHVHVSGVWGLSMIRALLFVVCVCDG